MHTVEMLERLKTLAEHAGYIVRHEWLGGAGGGACQFAGRKWIFVDLSLSVIEQLDQVAGALKGDPAVVCAPAPPAVQRYLGLPVTAADKLRRAACANLKKMPSGRPNGLFGIESIFVD